MELLKTIGDYFLFSSTFIVLGVGILLSFKTRFVQFRKLPHMFWMLFTLIFKRGASKEGKSTVKAHKALFTAMSTTIGISTIVSPVIAIRMGGPGAVLGFLFATLLGCAVNFTEVTFALSYRKNHPVKGIAGGPMQYLQDEIFPFVAKWYAFFGFILLMGWSAAQANQLGEILNSPLLGSIRIPQWITGAFLAVATTVILIGGIRRIADFSTKLVPLMFLLYVGGSMWIILANVERIPDVIKMVFQSAFAPKTFASGVTVGGIVAALRWGVYKGIHSNEAGVGTQTIPHSMAETQGALNQGILAMVSTYSAGFICILSSLVALLTETWLDPNLSLGINMVASSFQKYFSAFGIIIVITSAFLFAFGTILGNSYNGSQCFIYLTKNRFLNYYYVAIAILVFVGCLMDVASLWAFVDYLLVPVLLPHIVSIAYLAFKHPHLLKETEPASVPIAPQEEEISS